MPTSLHHQPLLEYWTSQATPLALPPGQTNAKRRWRADLMLMDQDNTVLEFAVNPDRKVTLSEMLEIIQQLMQERVSETTLDCGFRVW